MTPQGLLVKNDRGDEFLLATRSTTPQSGSDLIVSQKVHNQWIVLGREQAVDVRDRLMGALLEFFAGLCRTLSDRIGQRRTTLPPHRKTRQVGSLKPGHKVTHGEN